MGFNPNNPAKYRGTDQFLIPFVTRNRQPTGADYRQPETGRLYPIGCTWQVGKNPTSGTEGELWYLTKIVANVAYWERWVSSGPNDLTLTAQTGGALAPTAGNWNIFGAVTAQGTNPVSSSGAASTVTLNVQRAGSAATSTANVVGLAAFDTDDFSVDTNGFVNLNNSTVGRTITGDTGGALSPTAGNWNILGQQAGTIPVMYTIGTAPSTLRIENRTWTTPFVVDPSSTVGLRGTYTTISAAIADATTGQAIFIRPGTYTENITLDKSINLVTYSSGFREIPDTKIVGKITISTNVSPTINGVALETNGDFLLSVTGNGANPTFQNCYFNVTNNNAFQITGNGTTNVYLENCSGSFASSFGLGSSTGGLLWIKNCSFIDAVTPSAFNNSASSIVLINSVFAIPFSTSSAGVINAVGCRFGSVLTPFTDRTYITTAGTATNYITNCQIYSGTQSAISIGSGTTVELTNALLNSSNTNVITGAGTLKYTGLVFTGSSLGINVTTQQGGLLQGGRVQNPSVNYIGEVIQSSAINVACTSTTPTNITSISLTPGIWNISINVQATNTGSNVIRVFGGISTTSATLTGNKGDQQIQNGAGSGAFDMCCSLADYRVVNTSTTTYYLVGRQDFAAGTGTLNGRITATRVA